MIRLFLNANRDQDSVACAKQNQKILAVAFFSHPFSKELVGWGGLFEPVAEAAISGAGSDPGDRPRGKEEGHAEALSVPGVFSAFPSSVLGRQQCRVGGAPSPRGWGYPGRTAKQTQPCGEQSVQQVTAPRPARQTQRGGAAAAAGRCRRNRRSNGVCNATEQAAGGGASVATRNSPYLLHFSLRGWLLKITGAAGPCLISGLMSRREKQVTLSPAGQPLRTY